MAARRVIWFVTLGVLISILSVSSIEAQKVKSAPAKRVPTMSGAAMYSEYCAVCHGAQGKGNGPAAAALKTAPADLTTIAKRHGGTMSTTDVEQVILGEKEYLAHGNRDMPIWGPVFKSLSSDRAEVTLRLHNLVDYLKSIQVK